MRQGDDDGWMDNSKMYSRLEVESSANPTTDPHHRIGIRKSGNGKKLSFDLNPLSRLTFVMAKIEFLIQLSQSAYD